MARNDPAAIKYSDCTYSLFSSFTNNNFYLCGLCLVQCPTVDSLERHYHGPMHSKFLSENSTDVGCEICRIFDIRVDKFTNHLGSAGHLMALNKIKGEYSGCEIWTSLDFRWSLF